MPNQFLDKQESMIKSVDAAPVQLLQGNNPYKKIRGGCLSGTIESHIEIESMKQIKQEKGRCIFFLFCYRKQGRRQPTGTEKKKREKQEKFSLYNAENYKIDVGG